MFSISTHLPLVNGSSAPTYGQWSAKLAKVLHLETLARILAPLIRTDALALPCSCRDGSCDRCQLATICTQHQPAEVWNVYECEERGIGMMRVATVQARTADEAKDVARKHLEKTRYVGRLVARLKKAEDDGARAQAARDAEWGW